MAIAIAFVASVLNIAAIAVCILAAVATAAILQTPGAAIFAGIAALAVWLVVFTRLYTGQYRVYLRMAKGEPFEFRDLFVGGPYSYRVLLSTLLAWPVILVGYLLIVPGIFFRIVFGERVFVILDRQAPVLESLGISMRLTEGNRLMLFAIRLVAWLAGGAITSATGGIGAFAFVPFVMIMEAVMYLVLSGQPTIAPLPMPVQAGVIRPADSYVPV
jgi:hypothetical protein